MPQTNPGGFGSCCNELADAFRVPAEKSFHVHDNGVLYLIVGQAPTSQSPGYYDQAVIFCPFCGKQLQTREHVQAATRA